LVGWLVELPPQERQQGVVRPPVQHGRRDPDLEAAVMYTRNIG